jgi:DNA repair protein RadC
MIRDIPINERPRERVLNSGVESLSNGELLSIILRCGTKEKSVKDLSLEIISLVGDITNFKYLTLNKLLSIKGIGYVKAIELISVIELSKRIYVGNEKLLVKISSSLDVFNNYKDLFMDKNQELFYCLYLNNKNYVIERKLLFMGTINKSVVHPREIFKNAYLTSASGIICIHNHPSGDITPSLEDKRLTAALVDIGTVQNIPILDHIIIGKDNYFSFMENGLL